MSQASQVASVLIKDAAINCFEGTLKPFIRTFLTVQFSEKKLYCVPRSWFRRALQFTLGSIPVHPNKLDSSRTH